MEQAAEFIERAALEDLHRAANSDLATGLRLQSRDIGSTFVSIAAALPPSAIVINRAIGVGLGKPESEATTQALVAAYKNAGVARYFIQRHPAAAPAELVEWLLAAGLEKTRGWQKFERGLEPVEDRPSDLSVDEVGPGQGEAFARILCDAFDLGSAAVPWLARLPGRPGWHIFMASDAGAPAGTGALFIKDQLAWLDFGATAPAFRRRGCQSLLLARRIQKAMALGCQRFFTCTGEEVPGDPQHSYKNIMRAGFKETYVRENYAPPR